MATTPADSRKRGSGSNWSNNPVGVTLPDIVSELTNLLIIGPTWVGDMVMAQSLFMLIKQRQPDSRITVMAPDWTRPLLQRMPEVDASRDLPVKHGELSLGKRRAIGRSLQPEGFTEAIILPNSFKSALIPFHAGIPKRTAWRGEWRNLLLTDCRTLDKQAFPLMVQRFAALGLPPDNKPPASIPYPRLKIDPGAAAEALKVLGLEAGERIVGICPGAEYGESKQWPAVHYAALTNQLVAGGWEVWIFGSGNDRLMAESILADVDNDKLPRCKNLTGATSLAQAIDVLAMTHLVVSNDSGLMHIAAALGKPLVALYGSTSPDFTPPLTEKVKSLFTDIECRPCFKRECPYGHRRCLTEIKPQRALAAAEELLAGQ